MAKAPRAERLLALTLLLLQKQRPISRSDIRAMVKDYPEDATDEAFEKMFERDKEELRSLGFPIETIEIDDVEGLGYVLSNKDSQLEPIEFTAPERAALSLATRLWSGGVNQANATHALKKLESLSTPEERFESSAPLDYVSQDASVDVELMRAVDAAATQESVLVIKYRKPGEAKGVDRQVSPWGIVLHSGTSYLVGHDHERGEVRTFKLARIEQLPKIAQGVEYVAAEGQDPLSIVQAAIAELDQADDISTQVRQLLMTSSESAAKVASDSDPALAEAVSQTLRASQEAQNETDKLRESGAFAEPLTRLAKARKAASRKPAQDSSTQFTRILAIVPWLVNNPGVPTSVAAKEFGVSEEQLIKDLELAYCTEFGFDNVAMDIYIHSTLQVLDPQGIDRPLRFSVAEAYALQLGLLKLQQLPGIADSDAIVSAQEKLAAATGVGPAAVHVSAGEEAATTQALSAIEQAIAGSQVLEISYAGSQDSEPALRQVEPRSVSAVEGNNYLVAWCREAEGVRHFRFDRIQALAATGQNFDPNGSHNEVAELKPFGDETEFPVLRVSQSLAWWIDTIYDSLTVECGDGTLLASVPLGSSDWLVKTVAGFAGEVQIVEPTSLVDNFHDYLVRANAL